MKKIFRTTSALLLASIMVFSLIATSAQVPAQSPQQGTKKKEVASGSSAESNIWQVVFGWVGSPGAVKELNAWDETQNQVIIDGDKLTYKWYKITGTTKGKPKLELKSTKYKYEYNIACIEEKNVLWNIISADSDERGDSKYGPKSGSLTMNNDIVEVIIDQANQGNCNYIFQPVEQQLNYRLFPQCKPEDFIQGLQQTFNISEFKVGSPYGDISLGGSNSATFIKATNDAPNLLKINKNGELSEYRIEFPQFEHYTSLNTVLENNDGGIFIDLYSYTQTSSGSGDNEGYKDGKKSQPRFTSSNLIAVGILKIAILGGEKKYLLHYYEDRDSVGRTDRPKLFKLNMPEKQYMLTLDLPGTGSQNFKPRILPLEKK